VLVNNAAAAARLSTVETDAALIDELLAVNVRSPLLLIAAFDTALWANNKTIPGVVESIEAQTPLRRWAIPDDVADVVVFLAGDAARFITGETISVDGGMAHTLNLFGGPV
jgi:NAD(P)-dependent dehydrogenase (short-subunit alcohol dehydrogenase family)